MRARARVGAANGAYWMRLRLLPICLLCLLLLSGCSAIDQTTEPTTTPVATTESASGPTATEQTAEPSPAELPTRDEASRETATAPASPTDEATGLDAQFAQILERVVELNGLQPTAPITPQFISRDELRENLIQMQTEEYSAEDAQNDATTLWLMRLSDDRDLDLFQLYIDLLSEQVLGYYDPETDELFVVTDGDELSALAEMTLAHEMVHALQDQHVDLMALSSPAIDTDRAMGASAVIEGGAEVVATRYVLEYFSASQMLELTMQANIATTDVLNRAPAYIRETLYFPYIDGVDFATQVYESQGNDGLIALLNDPPQSTEQILHPEKYLDDRDDPQTVVIQDLEPVLGAAWSAVQGDTIGELDLRIMLQENGAADAVAAAAGWGGGEYMLYTAADDALLVVSTVWDSEDDADEFVTALGETLQTAAPTSGIMTDDAGRFHAVVADGTSVTLISGTNRATVDAARAALRSLIS